MLDEQELKLDGATYGWLYDDCAPPRNCWRWINVASNMTPAQALIARLNLQFIDERAADVAAMLDGADRDRFCEILESMGASREKLLAVFGMNPDRLPERLRNDPDLFLSPMPPAGHTPFNSPKMRDWFFGCGKWSQPTFSRISILGVGPFDAGDFGGFVRSFNIEPCEIDDTSAVVVLGREGWSKADVDKVIDLRADQTLRIYSQEMFLTYLSTRIDPFYAPPDVLQAFKAGHPGLEFVSKGWPGWVGIYVSENRRHTPSVRSNDAVTRVDQSPLHVLGYHVGKTGASLSVRQRILEKAFFGDLPIVASMEYMTAWGVPGSPDRLKRIAEHICCNIMAHANGSREAIVDWASDLDWLREKYYHGHMMFCWPATFV